MKRSLIALLLFVSATHSVFAAKDVMSLILFAEKLDGDLSRITGKLERHVTEAFGVYALAYTDSEHYHEWYVGPTWTPHENLHIGIGFGRENIDNSFRRNAFISAEKWGFSLHSTIEESKNDQWKETNVLYSISKDFRVGVSDESIFGIGPRFEYRAGNTTLWLSNLRKDRNPTTLVAIAFRF